MVRGKECFQISERKIDCREMHIKIKVSLVGLICFCDLLRWFVVGLGSFWVQVWGFVVKLLKVELTKLIYCTYF